MFLYIHIWYCFVKLHSESSAGRGALRGTLVGNSPAEAGLRAINWRLCFAEHDLAERDLAEHDLAEHDLAEHDLAEHDLAEHDLAEHDLAD